VAARGLLLDIGGVVLEPGPVLVNRLAQTEPALGRLLDPIGGAAGEGDDLWRRMLAGEVTERAYWAQRSAEITTALGRPGDTRALMDLLFAGPVEGWLRAQTLDLMAQVKAAGLRLGALTNDMADFHGAEWVAKQAWVDLFDVVVDGSLTGILKPDPRAFAAGVRAMRLPADQVVYLDDMPWNVDGGRAAGLVAVAMPHGDPAPVLAEVRSMLGLTAGSGPGPTS
jgi:putative hydrolase of the HAD superfamily